MIVDRLYESVCKRGPVCVGLDTTADYIPHNFLNRFSSVEDAVFEFNKKIIDACRDSAACFKVQIAYYEAMGLNGLAAYKKTLRYIREGGDIAISDIKRGDISQTALMYAKAHFEGEFETDLVTLNPYLGMDSIEPYLGYVKDREKGLFILVRTSNRGAEDLQYIEDREGKKVYRHTAEKIYELSKGYMGSCGYSSIGGVIGCTHLEEGKALREDFSKMFILIPGYGAQGGGASDVAVYLKDGNGGVVNSSRGILLAYKNHSGGEEKFDLYAREEVLRMREEIKSAAKVC
jgi:orotidine-5'-phosphate decarboxylase